MTLNKQLLCVSLLLLSLPWAGCQYLKEMDSALKSGQRETLQASATAIATALAQNPTQLDPHGEIVSAPQSAVPAIYCYPLKAPVRVDGYFDEWSDDSSEVPWSNYQSRDGRHQLRYRCGAFKGELALNFAVVDADVIYNNPTQSLAANGDRVILATGDRDYVLTAVAPGDITPRYFVDGDTTYRESRIKAAWIDNDKGYQIELKMPMSLADQRLGFSVIDATARGETRFGPFQRLFQRPLQRPFQNNRQTDDNLQAPRFVYQASAIEQALATFRQPGIRLRLCNPQGLLLASIGSPQPQHKPPAHWLLRRLYRAILDSGDSSYRVYSNGVDFSNHREFATALTGSASGLWYRDPQRANYQLLSTAVPVVDKSGRTDAVLIAEQSSEQTAALTDQAFSRLFLLSLAVLAFTALALLSYASWLSWRIRSLSRATQQALEDPRQLTRELPNSQARDEIGSLTRNYAQLMQRIAEYTDYLQTLARKLSHELRTPLAIIHSSLDNLASQPLDESSRTYQQRAKDGALRLGNILTAMSEARRVEESIEHSDPEAVEVGELLREVCHAYRDLYNRHHIELSGCDPDTSAVWITAVPDLLVQMLDKLMDNAASFCPQQQTIAIELEAGKQEICINISNDGPLLPQTMQSQLFDNMVSMRESNEKDVHLGLGLHIVSLIADYHGGRVSAENRPDGSGVIFHIHLPRNRDQRPDR